MDEFYCDNEYEFLVVTSNVLKLTLLQPFFLLLGMILLVSYLQ